MSVSATSKHYANCTVAFYDKKIDLKSQLRILERFTEEIREMGDLRSIDWKRSYAVIQQMEGKALETVVKSIFNFNDNQIHSSLVSNNITLRVKYAKFGFDQLKLFSLVLYFQALSDWHPECDFLQLSGFSVKTIRHFQFYLSGGDQFLPTQIKDIVKLYAFSHQVLFEHLEIKCFNLIRCKFQWWTTALEIFNHCYKYAYKTPLYEAVLVSVNQRSYKPFQLPPELYLCIDNHQDPDAYEMYNHLLSYGYLYEKSIERLSQCSPPTDTNEWLKMLKPDEKGICTLQYMAELIFCPERGVKFLNDELHDISSLENIFSRPNLPPFLVEAKGMYKLLNALDDWGEEEFLKLETPFSLERREWARLRFEPLGLEKLFSRFQILEEDVGLSENPYSFINQNHAYNGMLKDIQEKGQHDDVLTYFMKIPFPLINSVNVEICLESLAQCSDIALIKKVAFYFRNLFRKDSYYSKGTPDWYEHIFEIKKNKNLPINFYLLMYHIMIKLNREDEAGELVLFCDDTNTTNLRVLRIRLDYYARNGDARVGLEQYKARGCARRLAIQGDPVGIAYLKRIALIQSEINAFEDIPEENSTCFLS